MGGGASTEENSIHFILLGTHFLLQSIEVSVHHIIPAGNHGKVAVPAMMGTKGDVDIGRTWDEGNQLAILECCCLTEANSV